MPRLRFPGFEAEWESKTFGCVFAFICNNTLSRSELTYSRGNVRNIHYGDILVKFGDVIDFRNEEVPYIANQQRAVAERRLLDGDIIIADTAEDETVGKASEIYGLGDADAEAGLHTMACRPLRKFAPRFIGHYLNSPAYHQHLLPLMQGVKVLSLSKSQMSKTEICVPRTESEQAQIASFLSLLDSRITAQRKLVELLKKHKRGLVQALFTTLKHGTPKFRFVKVNDWESRNLSFFGSILRGVSFDGNTDVSATEDETTIRLLRSNNVEEGSIQYSDVKYIKRSCVSDRQIMRNGDILVCMANGSKNLVGKSALFSNADSDYTFGAFMGVFRCTDSGEAPFLIQLLQSFRYKKLLAILLSGSSINNLRPDDITTMQFAIPCAKERRRIATFLTLLDSRIAAAQATLDKCINMKHGLLQQLFV